MSAPSKPAAQPALPGIGQMLSWIRWIVGFGVRRPGYANSLAVENWLQETFDELGLVQVRREPVRVTYWEPTLTALAFPGEGAEVACSAVPYTAWTPPTGVEAPCAYLGEGSDDDFERVELAGRIAVLEARFVVLDGAPLKQQALFVRDAERSIPDGPLPFARWLIRNFPAYHRAYQRGAVGFVGLLSDLPIDGCEYYVPYDGFLKDLPAVWVGREAAPRLRALAQAGRRARLVSRGREWPVDSHNIVGIVPGSGRAGRAGKHPENVIVTCHHDAPFASAVEDASGLAVLLTLAQQFAAASRGPQALGRDLVFVASSGHFHGGIGNRAFVARHADGLLTRTAAAFGVEHIGEDVAPDGHGGYALTGRPAARALFFDGSRRLLDVLTEEAERAALDRVLGLDAYFAGPEPPCDSAPFFTAGIPAACHLAAPYYLFDPHDTIDKVCLPELPRVASFFAHVIRRVDALSAEELSTGMKRPRGQPGAPLPAWFRPPN